MIMKKSITTMHVVLLILVRPVMSIPTVLEGNNANPDTIMTLMLTIMMMITVLMITDVTTILMIMKKSIRTMHAVLLILKTITQAMVMVMVTVTVTIMVMVMVMVM